MAELGAVVYAAGWERADGMASWRHERTNVLLWPKDGIWALRWPNGEERGYYTLADAVRIGSIHEVAPAR